MQKKVMSLAVFCLVSLSNNANAQTTTNATPTAPTEVGKTTMPSGQYLMTDVSSGKQYSLTVTDKGTMIFGPAPAPAAPAAATTAATAKAAPSASSTATSGVKGLAEKQVEKYMQNKGMSELQNFIK